MKYGLDFGTSNSAISFYDGRQVSLLPIEPDSDTPELMPSLWYFETMEKEWFFGAEALSEYKANGGEGRLIQSLKKLLADDGIDGTHVGHRYYSIEDLLVLFFQEIKQKADKIVGKSIDAVTIGRPVRFTRDLRSDLAENRLGQAARRAGFETIDFMLEPLAATYGLKATIPGPATVFALDMGGGTSDVSVVRLCPPGGGQDRVLAARGVSIGGVDFTGAVMEHRLLPYFGLGTTYRTVFNTPMNFPRYALRHILDWYNSLKMIQNRKFMAFLAEVERTTSDPGRIRALRDLVFDRLGLDVFEAIERAKIDLSGETVSTVAYRHGAVDICEALERSQFEAYISSPKEAVAQMIRSALVQADLGPERIDIILLVGGSSQIPLFRGLVEEMFPNATIQEAALFTSVAHGLSVAGF